MSRIFIYHPDAQYRDISDEVLASALAKQMDGQHLPAQHLALTNFQQLASGYFKEAFSLALPGVWSLPSDVFDASTDVQIAALDDPITDIATYAEAFAATAVDEEIDMQAVAPGVVFFELVDARPETRSWRVADTI